MNNCLHICGIGHELRIYRGTDYRISDGEVMFCGGIKELLVVQLTYNYWVVGWNCVKVFVDWLDRMTI